MGEYFLVLLAAAATTAVQKRAVWGRELTVSVNRKEEGVQLESKRDRGGPCHSSFISFFIRLMLYINRLSCRSLLTHSTPRPESKPKELHLHPKRSSNLLTLFSKSFIFIFSYLSILISYLNPTESLMAHLIVSSVYIFGVYGDKHLHLIAQQRSGWLSLCSLIGHWSRTIWERTRMKANNKKTKLK